MASQFQLIAATLFLILANKVTSQTDSTTFNFTSYIPTLTDLTFQGDAHIPSGITNYIRLVSMNTTSPLDAAQNSLGRVLYSPPITFWVPGKQACFETTFTFINRYRSSKTGDGLTFFIVPVNSPIPAGSYGGNFGIFNPRTGLAPSVFAFEFDYNSEGEDKGWDPSYTHIGIDINSRVSRRTMRWDTYLGIMTTATINYDSPTRTINVFLTVLSESRSLSYVFDLKTILPQQVQVGISASTGDYISNTELYSWSFTSTLLRDDDKGIEGNAKNQEEYI